MAHKSKNLAYINWGVCYVADAAFLGKDFNNDIMTYAYESETVHKKRSTLTNKYLFLILYISILKLGTSHNRKS